jgi:hypothetical protein
MQVPALPVIAHDMQLPVQVVAQQTLFAQWPDLQSVSAAQVAPGGLGPQLPATQKLLAPVQSASDEQVVLQVPVAPQVYGAQDRFAGALQVPLPSQRPANDSVDPEQPGIPQATPATYSWQAPVPSQVPFLPQLDWPSSAQSSRGSVLTSAGRQVPTLSVEAHVTQTPAQAVLQQTPSAQKVESQSVPVLQGCPIAAFGGVVVWSAPPSVPTSPPVAGAPAMPLPPLPILPPVPKAPPVATAPPVPVVVLPLLLHAATPERIRSEATRSARTLGWGKPMVIGRPFLLRRRAGQNLQASVSGKGRVRHPVPEIILRAPANRIYDHL